MWLKQALHFGGYNKESVFSSATVPGWSQCSTPQKGLDHFFKESAKSQELAFFLDDLQLHTQKNGPLIFAELFPLVEKGCSLHSKAKGETPVPIVYIFSNVKALRPWLVCSQGLSLLILLCTSTCCFYVYIPALAVPAFPPALCLLQKQDRGTVRLKVSSSFDINDRVTLTTEHLHGSGFIIVLFICRFKSLKFLKINQIILSRWN